MKKTLIILFMNIFLIIGFELDLQKANAEFDSEEDLIKNNQIDQDLVENNVLIEKTSVDIAAAELEINKLENEMRTIQERIEKRNIVLKERAQAFQESGVNGTYLNVLLSSESFSDFVNLVGAVAAILQADQDLMEDQEIEKEALEDKQSEITSIIKSLEEKQIQLLEEQKQFQSDKELHNLDQLTKEGFADSSSENKYINNIIKAGYKFIGNSSYVFGGGRTENDIAKGRFDCSAFVHWAFDQAGIAVGNTTDALKTSGKQVSTSEIQPGDIVFFDTYKKDGHVGIYIGNGKFIGSQSSTGVAIEDMTDGYWEKVFNGRVVRV